MKHTLLAGLFLLGISSNSIASSPTDWVEQMLDSMAASSYSGTFVYLHNDKVDVVDVDTGVDGGGRFQHLHLKNGGQRNFTLENGVLSWFRENYWQKIGAPDNSSLKPSQLFALWRDRLSQYYVFSLGAVDRIADRSCQRVSIGSQDHYRYGYELCIDQQSKILLESKLVNNAGRLIEHILFTDISLNPAAVHRRAEPDNARKVVLEKTALNVPTLQRLPAGFKLMSREMKRLEGSKAQIEHWRISDGLANISVYVEPAKNESIGLVGGSNIGALSVYGMIDNGYQVTVIGDVPSQTLRVIADSLGS